MSAQNLTEHGLKNLKKVNWCLDTEALYSHVLDRDEGTLSKYESLVVTTGGQN